jgi:phenylacetate-coenzyme A ligase PaaK-like adenylate-forming protein
MIFIRFLVFYFIIFVGGLYSVYNKIVLNKNPPNVRQNLQTLLVKLNNNNDFFKGRFFDFLKKNMDKSDSVFLREFSKLPHYSKDDYLQAGKSIITGVEKPKLQLPSFWKGLKNLRNDWSYSMMTGGSSKKPLKVYMDKYHASRMVFSFFRCWYLMGWRPGHKMLLVYPKGVYDLDMFEKFNRISILTGFEMFFFNDLSSLTLKQLENRLNTYKPDIIVIFPSSLNKISRAINNGNIYLKHCPPMINVSGETFLDCQKQNCQKAFPKSKIHDSYGSVELGEIAHEHYYGLKVFDHFAYVETIPSDDNKTEIIVTLHDHDYFPFFRYEMGDVLSLYNNVIFNIEGKSGNKVTVENLAIYPRNLNKFINGLNLNIVDIQFVISNSGNMTLYVIYGNYQHNNGLISRTFFDTFGVKINVISVIEIEHDYRRKYRVIKDERQDIEYAGGVIDKLN